MITIGIIIDKTQIRVFEFFSTIHVDMFQLEVYQELFSVLNQPSLGKFVRLRRLDQL